MADKANTQQYAGLDIGLSLVGAWASWSQANEERKTQQANAAAQNRVRTANNRVRQANASLAAFLQATNNRRLMERAGAQFGAAADNLARATKARTQADFDAQIAGAEADGALAAAAAASGIGGTAINALSGASQLATQRMNLLRERQGNQVTQDQAAVLAGIIPSAARSQGLGVVSVGEDHSISQAPAGGASLFGALLNSALESRDSYRTLVGSLAPSVQQEQRPVSFESRPAVDVHSYAVRPGETYVSDLDTNLRIK